ncbi:MAG: hypothetical protein OXC48_07410, partial [Endozoicomonadaceae bacterium]|nr:hypothetical protein [Endozoicomonadaceae bacterium]
NKSSLHGLNIRAGRKGSKEVVKCVQKQNKNEWMIFTNTFTFAKKPNKLNFAVQGTLTIDGVVFDDIVLAQGHHGATNNWWFGGKTAGVRMLL